MSEIYKLCRGKLIVTSVFIFIAAALLAGFLGLFAADFFYGRLTVIHAGNHLSREETVQIIGGAWGAITGLIAAAVWCRVMLRRIRCGQIERLIGHGMRVGMAVGVLSAILLHAVLMLIAERESKLDLITGMVFGLFAGYILGNIGGIICESIVDNALKQLAASGKLEQTLHAQTDQISSQPSDTSV